MSSPDKFQSTWDTELPETGDEHAYDAGKLVDKKDNNHILAFGYRDYTETVLPIDISSYVNYLDHKQEEQKELVQDGHSDFGEPIKKASNSSEESNDSAYPSPATAESVLRSCRLLKFELQNLKKMAVTVSERATGDFRLNDVTKSDTEDFVYKISNHVYNDIRRFVNRDNRYAFRDVLPDFLESFAVRIGHERPDQISQNAMYLISKNRWSIADHINILISASFLESEGNIKQRDMMADMSFVDKVSTWAVNVKSEENHRQAKELASSTRSNNLPEDSCLYEAHRSVILNTSAYYSFIQRLQNETKLQREANETKFRKSGANIRKVILANTSTEVEYSREMPPAYDASFRFANLFTQAEFLSGSRPSSRSIQTMFDSITIISCAGGAQATSIIRYMRQMWPSTWNHTFLMFQDVLRCERIVYCSEKYVVKIPEGAVLSAQKTGNDLEVTVTGYANIIAEYAEQLAWLNTALLSKQFDEGPAFFCKLSNSEGTELKSISLEGSVGTEKPETAYLEKIEWWKNLLGFPFSVAQGFPINKQPDGCSGLEVSPDVLLTSLGASEPQPLDADSLLNGTRKSLALVHRRENILLWHEPHNNRNCQHCVDAADRSNNREQLSDLSGFYLYRHIVTPCREDWVQSLQQSRMSSVQETLNLTSKPIKTCSAIDMTDSQDTDPTESPFDSDMLSISDASLELEFIENGDPRSSILKEVAARLVAGYRTAAASNSPTTGQNSTAGAANFDQQGLSSPYAANESNGRGKRKRKDDKGQDKRTQLFAKRPKQGSGRVLACPFWKADHIKHRCCFGHKLTRIRDVKQHLSRRHTPIYCDRCKMIFPDGTSHDRHVLQPEGLTCEPSEILDGVTQLQANQLKRKSNAKLSEEEQWFAIWDILFQKRQRPNSAYMSSEVSEDLYLFRDYCRNHGEGELQNAGILADESLPEDARQNIQRITLSLGLDLLFETWLSSHSSSSGASQGALSDVRGRDRRRPLHSETSSESFRDSAIGTNSNRTAGTDLESNPTISEAGAPEPERRQEIVEERALPDLGASLEVDDPLALVDFSLPEDLDPAFFEVLLRNPDEIGFEGANSLDFSCPQELPMFSTLDDRATGNQAD